MNIYEELTRLQHYGREDIVQDLEERLRCWNCEARLTSNEMKKYGNLCERCEGKRVGGEIWG